LGTRWKEAAGSESRLTESCSCPGEGKGSIENGPQTAMQGNFTFTGRSLNEIRVGGNLMEKGKDGDIKEVTVLGGALFWSAQTGGGGKTVSNLLWNE